MRGPRNRSTAGRAWVLGSFALVLGGILAVMEATLQVDRERVVGRATTLASPWGALEYLVGGTEGPWVLLIHGAGGGYDLGELMAEILLSDGFRWLAPMENR